MMRFIDSTIILTTPTTLRLISSALLGLSVSSAALALEPYTAEYGFNIDNRWSGQSSRVLRKDGEGGYIPLLHGFLYWQMPPKPPDFDLMNSVMFCPNTTTCAIKSWSKIKITIMNFDATAHKINVDVSGKKSTLDFKSPVRLMS